MPKLLARSLCFYLAVIMLGTGCTSLTPSKERRPPAAVQLQRSLALTAGRYAEVFEALDGGKLEEAKNDLDWWIDMAIIELQLLEDRHPDENLGAVKIPETQFTMRTIYKSIAQFRLSHPRQHIIPMTSETLGLIDKFVQKYQ